MANPLIHLVPRWRSDPVALVHDTFESDPYGNPVVLDDCQVQILEALRDHDRIAVQSGRGVGKTATAALATHVWLGSRQPSLVVASAGSWNHLTDKLWPEIGAWGRNWLLRELFEYQEMGIFSNVSPETWRAVAASSDKAVNVEGFHSPNLLLIIDEAKGMPDEIYAALIASLSGDPKLGSQKALVLSTPPPAEAGWFAKACVSDRWHTIQVSGLDSKRVSKAYIDDIIETFGEHSPEYQAYVLGAIPTGGTGQLIRKAWLEAAQARGPNKRDRRRPVITCDVARFGDDLATIGVFEHAKFNLVRFEDGKWGWWSTNDLALLKRRVRDAVVMHKAGAVCVDDAGLGGGVTDGLRELQVEGAFPRDCSIIPINFGSRPRKAHRFDLRKHELWWRAREALRVDEHQAAPLIALPTEDEIREWRLPRGSDFRTQLLSPTFETNTAEQIVVYDKRVSGKERTKALPIKSPDLAHAVILGLEYYLGEEVGAEVREPASSSEEALRRMMQDLIKKNVPKPANPFRR